MARAAAPCFPLLPSSTPAPLHCRRRLDLHPHPHSHPRLNPHTTAKSPPPQIGPRLELEVVKVEEGLCDGAVLYHAHERRSAAEAAAQRDKVAERERLRAERRRQQEVRARAGRAGSGGCGRGAMGARGCAGQQRARRCASAAAVRPRPSPDHPPPNQSSKPPKSIHPNRQANVARKASDRKRKEMLEAAAKARKEGRAPSGGKKAWWEEELEAAGGSGSGSGDDGGGGEGEGEKQRKRPRRGGAGSDDDDAEYFRQEVGMEPDTEDAMGFRRGGGGGGGRGGRGRGGRGRGRGGGGRGRGGGGRGGGGRGRGGGGRGRGGGGGGGGKPRRG
jgi:hypothetical protein